MAFQRIFLATSLAALLASCAETPAAESTGATVGTDPPPIVLVRDTVITDVLDAPATAEPLLEATVSTKLMGRIVEVAVRDGDRVRSGALLVRLDGRELTARLEQAQAALQSAEAAHAEAGLQAERFRALFADSAAPRAQLDAVEAGLVRAEQAVRAARAGTAEIEALADYSELRAPFSGTIVQRYVDPGTLAAPGTPILRIEDASTLRLIAPVAPALAAGVRRGAAIAVSIEGVRATGKVEAVVPAPGASLVRVQVLVDNADGRFSSGSAATVSVPAGSRTALLIPESALVRRGDLTGVRLHSRESTVTRWVRLGRSYDGFVEVLSGLSAGDTILAATPPAGA